jgi:hypothetical protein
MPFSESRGPDGAQTVGNFRVEWWSGGREGELKDTASSNRSRKESSAEKAKTPHDWSKQSAAAEQSCAVVALRTTRSAVRPGTRLALTVYFWHVQDQASTTALILRHFQPLPSPHLIMCSSVFVYLKLPVYTRPQFAPTLTSTRNLAATLPFLR